MGLLGGLVKGVTKFVGGGVKAFLPKPEQPQFPQYQQPPQQLPPPRQRSSGGLVGPRGSGSVFESSPIDVGPLQFDPFALLPQGGQQQQQRPQQLQGFQGALMASMMEKSVRSKSGRAVFEAMTAGSLQRGMIQPTTTVETPRGVENHSPPGFRTVYVRGEPYAVFKPMAEALNLLPKRSKPVITRADLKCFNKADRLAKRLKKLTQKSGKYKVTNK